MSLSRGVSNPRDGEELTSIIHAFRELSGECGTVEVVNLVKTMGLGIISTSMSYT
jgi:hypothetical protein